MFWRISAAYYGQAGLIRLFAAAGTLVIQQQPSKERLTAFVAVALHSGDVDAKCGCKDTVTCDVCQIFIAM